MAILTALDQVGLLTESMDDREYTISTNSAIAIDPEQSSYVSIDDGLFVLEYNVQMKPNQFKLHGSGERLPCDMTLISKSNPDRIQLYFCQSISCTTDCNTAMIEVSINEEQQLLIHKFSGIVVTEWMKRYNNLLS